MAAESVFKKELACARDYPRIQQWSIIQSQNNGNNISGLQNVCTYNRSHSGSSSKGFCVLILFNQIVSDMDNAQTYSKGDYLTYILSYLSVCLAACLSVCLSQVDKIIFIQLKITCIYKIKMTWVI